MQGKERSSGFGKPAHSFGAPFKSTCSDFGKSTSRTESLTDLWQSSRAHLSSQAHAGTDMWKRKLQSTGEQRSPLRCTCIVHWPSSTSFPSLPLTCLRLTGKMEPWQRLAGKECGQSSPGSLARQEGQMTQCIGNAHPGHRTEFSR